LLKTPGGWFFLEPSGPELKPSGPELKPAGKKLKPPAFFPEYFVAFWRMFEKKARTFWK
jgi:hypothetical protein